MAGTVKLRLEGTLTHEDYWADYWGDCCYDTPRTSFNYFKSQYEWEAGYLNDDHEVRVTIHSEGGLCDVGYQCYDFLTTLGKKVTTVIQGDCMSAATIVFLAGSTRLIPRHGSLMIHLPEGKAQGNVTVFENYLVEMREETQKLIDFYVRVTGQTEEVISELLAASTILSAERAVELGFATGILEPISARAFVPAPKPAAAQPAPATPAPAPAVPSTLSTTKKTRMSNKRGLMQTLIGAIVNLASGGETTVIALKLADGRTLNVAAATDTEAIGDTAEIDDATAADGDYTLENGTVITIKDGVIEGIVEATTNNGGTTETPAPATETPAPTTGGTTSAPTNSGSTSESERITNLETQLQTVTQERDTARSERDAANNRVSMISNRVSKLEGLMGVQESAPVSTPVGSGANPSQKTNHGGTGSDNLDDTMKNIASKYEKPTRRQKS